MALPAFAAVHRAAAIDRYLRIHAGPTAANLPHAAKAGEWDRQTGHPIVLYTPRSAYYAGSAIDELDVHDSILSGAGADLRG